MKIIINDKLSEFKQAHTLEEVLKQLALPSLKGIAVALNDRVVSRQRWPETRLKDQDKLLIIRATQGG